MRLEGVDLPDQSELEKLSLVIDSHLFMVTQDGALHEVYRSGISGNRQAYVRVNFKVQTHTTNFRTTFSGRLHVSKVCDDVFCNPTADIWLRRRDLTGLHLNVFVIPQPPLTIYNPKIDKVVL